MMLTEASNLRGTQSDITKHGCFSQGWAWHLIVRVATIKQTVLVA